MAQDIGHRAILFYETVCARDEPTSPPIIHEIMKLGCALSVSACSRAADARYSIYDLPGAGRQGDRQAWPRCTQEAVMGTLGHIATAAEQAEGSSWRFRDFAFTPASKH